MANPDVRPRFWLLDRASAAVEHLHTANSAELCCAICRRFHVRSYNKSCEIDKICD
jgi:hypothetical protein